MLDAIKIIDGYDEMKTTVLYNDLNSRYGENVIIYIKNKKISIYPIIIRNNKENVKIIKIPFESITYFAHEGDIYREQVISGGGSGDINYEGAIVGGLIAGSAGMVVGGQRKVNEVTSKTVEHDTRKIRLLYTDKDGNKSLYFPHDCYDFFLDCFPEKDYEVVTTNKKKKHIKVNDEVSLKEKIKELKNMLEEGLITQEEYDEKRKKLLDE